jgi:hypothetical protein
MKMMRVVVVVVLVAALGLSWPGDTSLAQEVLTNDSVIQMLKAGLPEGVVISKIKSTASKFDLKTDSLVNLKKAGVSDKVLEAMMAAGSGGPATAAATPAPPAPALAAGALKTQDVVYQLIGDKYVELMPLAASMETNFAFFQSKSEIVLPGRKAQYRTTEKTPVFLTTYAPTEAPMVKFKPGDDHDDRNLKFSSGAFMPFGGSQKTGVRNDDKIPITTERDPRGFYRVKPSAPLPPGEYGFVVTTGFSMGTGKIFEFGVD